jgi:hypothetical protein
MGLDDVISPQVQLLLQALPVLSAITEDSKICVEDVM